MKVEVEVEEGWALQLRKFPAIPGALGLWSTAKEAISKVGSLGVAHSSQGQTWTQAKDSRKSQDVFTVTLH